MVRVEGHTWNSFDFNFLTFISQTLFYPTWFSSMLLVVSPLWTNTSQIQVTHMLFLWTAHSLQQHPSGGGSQQCAAGHAGSTLCSHLFTEVSGQAVLFLLTKRLLVHTATLPLFLLCGLFFFPLVRVVTALPAVGLLGTLQSQLQQGTYTGCLIDKC